MDAWTCVQSLVLTQTRVLLTRLREPAKLDGGSLDGRAYVYVFYVFRLGTVQ
jgi:hypothetical protein